MPDPREPGFVDLAWLLEMTHEQYLDRFRGTAIRRAKYWMLQRNAAVALGNVGGPEDLEPLGRSLSSNPNSFVRGHAAWAIGRIGVRNPDSDPTNLLRNALETEEDRTVREEIELALAELEKSLETDDPGLRPG